MKNGESRVLIRIENMNRPFRSSIFMDARQRYERKFSLKWKINDWPLGKQSDTNALFYPVAKALNDTRDPNTYGGEAHLRTYGFIKGDDRA